MEPNSIELIVVPGREPETATIEKAPAEDCTVPLSSHSLHDLAGPINQVSATVGLLLKRYQGRLGNDAETLFGYIESSTNRLQNLLAGLYRYLEMAGSSSPSRYCDGEELLAASVCSIQRAIDEHNALVTHGPLPELYCDPTQISFVFTSLIENSIKFRRQDKPTIHVSAVEQEDKWVLSVSDNGLGIASKNYERIFGVFTRVHPEAYPGAGVGLAVARRVIERHHGRIWVESEVGRGTTISFTLPFGGDSRPFAIV